MIASLLFKSIRYISTVSIWKRLTPKTWAPFPSYHFYIETVPVVTWNSSLLASVSQSRTRLPTLRAANPTMQLLTKDSKSESPATQEEDFSHHFKANLYWHRLFLSLNGKIQARKAPTETKQCCWAPSTPYYKHWKYKEGKQPWLESCRARSWWGYELSKQHTAGTRASTPAPVLPQRRVERAKEDLENQGLL